MIATYLQNLLAYLWFLVAPFFGSWVVDDQTGCRVWYEWPFSKETVSWNGGCADGTAEGRGVLKWFRDGELIESYQGMMQNGRLHGRGLFTRQGGAFCDGEWVNGELAGQAVCVDEHKIRYG